MSGRSLNILIHVCVLWKCLQVSPTCLHLLKSCPTCEPYSQTHTPVMLLDSLLLFLCKFQLFVLFSLRPPKLFIIPLLSPFLLFSRKTNGVTQLAEMLDRVAFLQIRSDGFKAENRIGVWTHSGHRSLFSSLPPARLPMSLHPLLRLSLLTVHPFVWLIAASVASTFSPHSDYRLGSYRRTARFKGLCGSILGMVRPSLGMDLLADFLQALQSVGVMLLHFTHTLF